RAVELEATVYPGLSSQSGRIDEHEVSVVVPERRVYAVARGARHLAYHHPVLAQQPVDEAGLTHVRLADHCDVEAAILTVGIDFRQLIHDDIEQVARPLADDRTHR